MTRRLETGVALGLVALTCALRAPFAGLLDIDEGFFATVGRDWAHGALPYAENFDVKPPGLFLLHALMQPWFGAGLLVVKGMEAAAVAASAYGLWRLGRSCFSPQAGLVAAALYPLYSLAMSGVSAPAPLWLSCFEIFAVLAAFHRRAALAGLLFGCAFTVKQTAAIEAAAVLAALLYMAPARDRFALGARFLAGCAFPAAAFALYFLWMGAFAAFWSAVVTAASGRLAGDNVGFLEGLTRVMPSLRPLLAPAVGALLVGLRLRQFAATAFAPGLRLILAWAGGGFGSVIAQRAMYDHYFLPLAPPLLLLGACAALHVLDFGRRRRLGLAACGLAALLCPVLFGMAPLVEAGAGEDRSALLAAERTAQAAGLRPGDTALAVSRGAMFYPDTGAKPPGRVFHPQHLLCEFPGLQGDPLAQAMAAEPRFVLLADARYRMVCEKPERVAALKQRLAADYELAGQVFGRWDSYEIYRRK